VKRSSVNPYNARAVARRRRASEGLRTVPPEKSPPRLRRKCRNCSVRIEDYDGSSSK
jgi:hypothetical protein